MRNRAAVVGGSIGGLSAALLLRDAGWAVDVYERSAAVLEGRGGGIVLHPSTIRYLVERAGVAPRRGGASRCTGCATWTPPARSRTRNGAAIASPPTTSSTAGCSSLTDASATTWPRNAPAWRIRAGRPPGVRIGARGGDRRRRLRRRDQLDRPPSARARGGAALRGVRRLARHPRRRPGRATGVEDGRRRDHLPRAPRRPLHHLSDPRTRGLQRFPASPVPAAGTGT